VGQLGSVAELQPDNRSRLAHKNAPERQSDMRARTAIEGFACAATLCVGIGVAATGAGAAARPSSPAGKVNTTISAKVMESAAVRSAFASLQNASHIKSAAARQQAVRADLSRLRAAVRAADANVRPSAFALHEEHSAAVRRAEREMIHPGSIARGTHLVEGELRAAAAIYPSGFTTSSNWSGYVDTSGSYNYVFGEWTVPYANCGPWYDFNFSQSSTWVGLDGWNSSTVEQLGTATGCVAGGSVYYAWTEMYPQIEDPIWNGISPGDHVMAFVYSYNNNTEYELWMADLSQGWSNLRFGSSSTPLSDSSAEWITERPTCWLPCDNLTNFGTTTFTSSYAIGNNSFGSINSFPNYAVDLYANNVYCAEVGGLSNSGTAFTDWWTHS
jgi:hypothetical protein